MISAPIEKLTKSELESRVRYHRTLADLYETRKMPETANSFRALAQEYDAALQAKRDVRAEIESESSAGGCE